MSREQSFFQNEIKQKKPFRSLSAEAAVGLLITSDVLYDWHRRVFMAVRSALLPLCSWWHAAQRTAPRPVAFPLPSSILANAFSAETGATVFFPRILRVLAESRLSGTPWGEALFSPRIWQARHSLLSSRASPEESATRIHSAGPPSKEEWQFPHESEAV